MKVPWELNKNSFQNRAIKLSIISTRGDVSLTANFSLLLQRLWRSGEATEVIGPLRVVHQYVHMPEQSAEYYNRTTGQFEKVNSSCQS
jgi:hypothetical protein